MNPDVTGTLSYSVNSVSSPIGNSYTWVNMAQKYGERERPGRTLAWLLHPSPDGNYVTELLADDSSVLHDNAGILKEFLNHYQQLYTTHLDSPTPEIVAYLVEAAMLWLS